MYRISKIKTIGDTNKTYQKDIDIESFIKYIQTPFPRYQRPFKEHLVDVVLKVDASKAFYFTAKKFLTSQKEEKQEDGSLIVSYKVTQPMEVEELIKKWLPHVKVLEPLSLKEKIENELKSYLGFL